MTSANEDEQNMVFQVGGEYSVKGYQMLDVGEEMLNFIRV